MKIKTFQGVINIDEQQKKFGIRKLEDKVQEWLDGNEGIEIREIKQSSSTSGDSEGFGLVTVISIWYEIKTKEII